MRVPLRRRVFETKMRFFTAAVQSLNESFWGRWLLFAFVLGVFAGCGGVIFHYLIEWVQYISLATFGDFPLGDTQSDAAVGELPRFNIWLVLPMMGLGGLLAGLIVHTFATEAQGAGTDAAIDSFHNRRGMIAARVPLVKAVASAITLGTGGSAGYEGPISQIGAGIGSVLSQRLKLSVHDRRIMLAIGMGAGVGAVFRAPLAGTIFAGEIMYRDADIESEVIIPGAIASTVAYAVFQSALPPSERFMPLFGELGQYRIGGLAELLPYTILAVLLVAASAVYVRAFHTTQRLFDRLPLTWHFKPMLGAVLAALVIIGSYLALRGDERILAGMGSGYGFLQQAIVETESVGVRILLLVAAVKIVTTSLTVGSGGSGGVFGPSMVIGGSLGAAVGKTFHQLMPGIVAQPGAYSIVGMAGFFAGCANAPFSTILMVSEMTGHYRLLVPTVWVAAISFILGRRWSLYSSQVNTRLDSPAHQGDFTIDLLEGMAVRDIFLPKKAIRTYREDASLDQIVHSLSQTSQRYFPVLDFDGKLVGIFSADDVRLSLYDELLWKVAIARDIMVESVVTLQPDDDLNTALYRFTSLNVDELPVVDSRDPNKLLGFLRRKETIAAYTKRRLELKRQSDLEHS